MDESRDDHHGLAESSVEALIGVVLEAIASFGPRLLEMAFSGDRGERTNRRHYDNFLSNMDLELHAFYRERVADVLGSCVYASEEDDPVVVGLPIVDELPEYLVLVDPLDTSELAVRGLFGYTHLVLYSLRDRAPLASIVGDFYHEVRVYYAYKDSDSGRDTAWLRTRSNVTSALRSRPRLDVEQALVTSYSLRPKSRFRPVAAQHRLLDAMIGSGQAETAARIGVDFGSVGLCHVAAGFTDAFVEFAKGFALWDLYPGQYILTAAGGCVTDLTGTELGLDLQLESMADVKAAMSERQTFVAAGSPEACRSLAVLLEDPRLPIER